VTAAPGPDPVPAGPDPRAAARDAARDAAISALATTAVELALIVGLSLAVQHRDTLRARAAWLIARARRRRLVDELELAESARQVSEISHGEPL